MSIDVVLDLFAYLLAGTALVLLPCLFGELNKHIEIIKEREAKIKEWTDYGANVATYIADRAGELKRANEAKQRAEAKANEAERNFKTLQGMVAEGDKQLREEVTDFLVTINYGKPVHVNWNPEEETFGAVKDAALN